ncbi:hypothetical protein [Maridesulfovibrio ferrireducens]|uniref:hypothetical protein n=1 Tax=Maridesulfovibrio ferrireducens TaxID=246191 RepID=UPI001A225B8D|nr:hypothetical protein [Maridesulfovibrio ferrireducens]MBI9112341.1 hypothetical protein [Maridesulfovibrio ferrireducens]
MMNITLQDSWKIKAGLLEIIPAENLIFSYKNEQIKAFLDVIKSLPENKTIFAQLPVLLKYKDQPKDSILTEIVMNNCLTGFFVCFCATVALPDSTTKHQIWDSEWFYVPENNLDEIEINLQTWLNEKRKSLANSCIFNGIFSIIHAPSVSSTPECIVDEIKFYDALKKLPDSATIFKQVPTLEKINTVQVKKNLHETIEDAKLKFIQNLIKTASLTGYFVELGMQVIISSNEKVIHLTKWIYVSTLKEAENILNTWLNERDKELVGEDK